MDTFHASVYACGSCAGSCALPAVIPFSVPRLHPSSKATETRPLESGKTIGVRHSPFAISAPARDTATSAFPSSTARGTSSPGSSEHGPNSYAELALQHLKRLVGDPDAQWKCPEQKLATVAMLELRQDVIAVMATSSGKSMIAILPSLVEHNKITVLILPLRALMLDFSTKLRRMNVPFEVYEPSRPLQGSFNLILVSADYAKTDGWRQSIARINQKRPVVRQIFDEAHIPPTAEHYRAALEQMSDIRCSFPCQIGLLSATITPLLEKRLIKDYCMNDVLVLRTCTNRPELQYEWLPRTSSEELPSLVRQQVAQLVKTPKDRGLIFVPTKVIGEAIAEELGYPFFYSTPDVEEQKGIYGSWVQGTTPTIVCTSAFGTGNDNPHVCLVIHAGTPYELIEFIQEVSRGGRDHQPATCVLLPTVTRNVPEDLAESEDFSGRRPMADLLKGDEICIRAAVMYYIDGVCRSRKESASRPSPFEASTEQAKHQRMERLKLASDYIANFKRQLSRFENMCAFCLCFKKGLSGHELVHCPSIKEHSGPDAPGHFFSWRRKLKYNTDYHTGICYTCHVPQGKHDALHDTFRRGKLACEYPDIIAPAVYASLLQPKERAHLAATFGQTWNTPSDAVPWLNSKPVEGHASNISALFLRLMEDKK
ncbi:hypothetical protein NLJ89_g6639 [Agrocybe chaxingu]|uniref:DNA 3'-5' helicase n=1 Tax=Agrocybe chaxingu TaxID=84603 RepID=A0A9W8JYV2_9AGAR|nr:hypothetical protein NLJ89_g6639 [Agrocybe chaxingu]